jgi:hypothetical protein
MSRFLPVLIRVTRLMFQFARAQGNDRVVIGVHPKHGGFYERFFGFRPMAGDLRSHGSVRNAPAVAYSLDWSWMSPERTTQFFGSPVPAADLCPQPWPEDELAHFAPAAVPLGQSELLSGGYEEPPVADPTTETVIDRPGIT